MAYLGNSSLPFDPTRTSVAPRDADRFSGNGSTTSFTLTRSVSLATDIEVFVENVQQEPITAYDVNGTSLNFTGAPPSGTNNVYVVYRNFQSGAQVTMPDGSVTYSKLANNLRVFTTDNLVPNGSTVAFTLSEAPADANTVMVTVDGIVQRAPVHYTTSGSTITFTSAPAASSNVHVRHLGFRTSATVTQLAANSTISQPIIQTPTISGTATFTGSVGVGVSSPTTGLSISESMNLSADYSTYLVNSYYNGGWKYVGNGYAWGIGNNFTGQTNVITLATAPTNASGAGAALTWSAGISLDSSGNFKANSGYGSVATAYFCRAWVNFNGTGTVAIRGSGNVSSITDNGAGDYTVNFTNAMPDANYAMIGTASGNYAYTGDGMGPGFCVRMSGTSPTLMSTTAVRIGTSYGNSVGSDYPATVMNVAILR